MRLRSYWSPWRRRRAQGALSPGLLEPGARFTTNTGGGAKLLNQQTIVVDILGGNSSWKCTLLFYIKSRYTNTTAAHIYDSVLSTVHRWESSIMLCASADLTTYEYLASGGNSTLSRNFESTLNRHEGHRVSSEARWSCVTSSFMLLKHHFAPAERDKSKYAQNAQRKRE